MISLSENEYKLLKLLEPYKDNMIPVDVLEKQIELSKVQIISTSTSLQQKNLVKLTKEETIELELTDEGKTYLKDGLPEKQILPLIEKKEMTINQLQQEAKAFLDRPLIGIAIGWLKKKDFVTIEPKKDGKKYLIVTDKGKANINEKTDTELALQKIDQGKPIDEKNLNILKKRNLVNERKIKQWSVKIGKEGLRILSGELQYKQEVSTLTREHIEKGEWNNIDLKTFDVTLDPPTTYPAKFNPYLDFLDLVREILIGMGFQEAKGPLVEAELYNFDGLFQAQNHIAREIHDSYILEYPQTANIEENEFIKKVREAHETGLDPQSTGWQYKWNFDIAKRLVLRSQTTAVSLRELIKDSCPPRKVFSIDRNYRPDTIDRTHGIEFRQCEGIVLAKGLTVRHLLGYLKEFAEQLVPGTQVKFKPAYFPFTEPSVEAFIKIPKLGWVEMLGSGLFRPELLRTLGVDYPDVQCLAWGIGIDRFAMIKLALDHIKHLHSPDLEFLRNKTVVL